MMDKTDSTVNSNTLEIVNFFSKLNEKELPYCVITPENYAGSTLSYPVLYLLHGLFGRFDNWITNTNLVEYAKDYPFLIVCADGGDNWYTDKPQSVSNFYESYIIQELIPHVENRFTARAEKKSRSIAGLSMGGYGAFKLAFRYPEMFCLAASMSGAFHASELFDAPETSDWEELLPSIISVFGSDISETRRQNNLFEMAANFSPEKIKDLPYFYFNCGVADSFLPTNSRLANIFREKLIPYEFQTLEGGHDWDYWNRQLPRILETASIYLK